MKTIVAPSLAERVLGRTVASSTARPSRSLRLKWTASPFNGSGYARVSRELLPALQRRGVDLQLEAWGSDGRVVAEIAADPRAKAGWDAMLRRKLDHGVHVLFHPPRAWNGTPIFRNARAASPQLDVHAGYTMFETDRMPRGWADECAAMDAVLVPSTFVRDVFARSGVPAEKLIVLPHGLDWRPYARATADFDLPGRRGFAFLSIFEWTFRKGWDLLLDAWAEAFAPRDDVTLVVRASVPKDGPGVSQRIDAHLRSRGLGRRDVAPILVLDAFVPEARMPALYASCDAFVLPTRGEGWGLPLLEAMGSGLPTIATDWSGQLDFMRPDNAWLVEVEAMDAVDRAQIAENPYFGADHRWARPSRAALVAALRDVFDHRDEARLRAAAARDEVRETWSADRVAGIAERELLDLEERCRGERAGRGASRAVSDVVWKAPIHGVSGFADEARQFVLGLDEIGRAPKTAPVWWGSSVDLAPEDEERLDRADRRVAADRFVLVHHVLPRQLVPLGGRAIDVARAMFETAGVPDAVVQRLRPFEEIWVPTRFNAETFAAAGLDAARIHVVPEGLDARLFEQRSTPLRFEGARGFTFLSVFDWTLRKGWDVLLRAWAEAFGPADDVVLVLKAHASSGIGVGGIAERLEAWSRQVLGRSTAELADIVLLDTRIPAPAMPRLYAAADVFVLPTRGEGWCRPAMEAMARGVPVVATGWSGLTAFLDEDTGWPLPHRIVPVPPAAVAETPIFAGQRWAEPDVGALVDVMRRAAAGSDRDELARRAARGRARVLVELDRRVVAARVAERVDALLARPRS